MTTVRSAAEIAGRFVAARRSARPLTKFPGPVPVTLADAYAVQDAAVSLIARPIVGWKVGRIMAPLSETFGTDRLAGPIFALAKSAPGCAAAAMPIFADGFAAAEAELLLRVGRAPDPDKHQFTLDEAIAHIDCVRIGIEIASSPLGKVIDLGPTAIISDLGINNGLVVGAEVEGWRSADFLNWNVITTIDGIVAGTGRPTVLPSGPFESARFLLEWAAWRGIGLRPGQWISSGAVTGVHKVGARQRVEARFGDELVVECLIDG